MLGFDSWVDVKRRTNLAGIDAAWKELRSLGIRVGQGREPKSNPKLCRVWFDSDNEWDIINGSLETLWVVYTAPDDGTEEHSRTRALGVKVVTALARAGFGPDEIDWDGDPCVCIGIKVKLRNG